MVTSVRPTFLNSSSNFWFAVMIHSRLISLMASLIHLPLNTSGSVLSINWLNIGVITFLRIKLCAKKGALVNGFASKPGTLCRTLLGLGGSRLFGSENEEKRDSLAVIGSCS